MMKSIMVSMAGVSLAIAGPAAAQSPEWTTPTIQGYGKIKNYPNAAERPIPGMEYKLVWAIDSDAQREGVNRTLWSAARVVNLLTAGGVPQDDIDIAIVLYGPAIDAALTNEAYAAAHDGAQNPNLELMKALHDFGVKFYACGQTMAGSDIAESDLNEFTEMSLSAQIVLTNYALQGYVPMPDG